jgi:hypothetical protein
MERRGGPLNCRPTTARSKPATTSSPSFGGINVMDGKPTHKAVAEAHEMDWSTAVL